MNKYKDASSVDIAKMIRANHEMMDLVRVMAANSIANQAASIGHDPNCDLVQASLHAVLNGSQDDCPFIVGLVCGLVSITRLSSHFQTMLEETHGIEKDSTSLANYRREHAPEKDPLIAMFTEMLKKAGLNVVEIPGFGVGVDAKLEDQPKIDKIFNSLDQMNHGKPN